MTKETKKDFRILHLHSENIKKVKVIDVKPDRNVVMVTGKNENGKTSLLDSISYVLGGKGLIPKKPVRIGEEGALIQMDLGDFIVQRKWTTPEKSTLKITHKEGYGPNSQEFLNSLIGNLAFDPLEFVSMEKKKRLEILKTITNLNFDEQDQSIAQLMEERKDKNKEKNANEIEIKALGVLPDMKKVRPIEIVQKEWEEKTDWNEKISDAITDISDSKEEIETQELIIKTAQEKIDSEKKLISDSLEWSKKKVSDIDKIKTELVECRKSADLQYKVKRKTILDKEKDSIFKTCDALTNKIEAKRKEKNDAVAAAKMPVKGLDFGEDDVLFNGIEFSEISFAQKIKVSMAIAFNENPKLKIVRILNGSLLDDDSLKEVIAMAKKHDFQVWIEQVTGKKGPGENVIYIEEGEQK